MIHAAVFAHPLHCQYRAHVGHHADRGTVAVFVGADRADLAVGQVLTDRAEMNLPFGIKNRGGKGFRIGIGPIQNRKRHAHGAFSADPVQSAELLRQILEGFNVFRHVLTSVPGYSAG